MSNHKEGMVVGATVPESCLVVPPESCQVVAELDVDDVELDHVTLLAPLSLQQSKLTLF